MIYIFAEDPHIYRVFKNNIIKYGTGKMVISLYNDWESLKMTLKTMKSPEDLLLIQSTTLGDDVEHCRKIILGTEDLYDENGVILGVSLCRSFKELMGKVAGEVDLNSGGGRTALCKTYYGICDEGVSRLSMIQRLSSMAVQYGRQMMVVDLDLGGDVSDEIKRYSDRVVYQLVNGGKIQWGGLSCKEHSNIFYFKPFSQIADTHLLDLEFIKQLKTSACGSGIDFIMALHKGSLSAPSHALGRHYDVHFVIGASFERERLSMFEAAHSENLLFFSNTSTRQSGDQLTDWHRYMNGEMRNEQGGSV